MNPYLDPLAAELEEREYSYISIRRQLRNADSFGRWLVEQQIPLADVTGETLARYTAPMHRCPGPSRAHGYRPHNARGLPRLIGLLTRQGVVPKQEETIPASVEHTETWLLAFDQHLERVAGVSAATRNKHRSFARAFLTSVFGEGEPDFAQIRAEHVSTFVHVRAEKLALTSRKAPGETLRVFLRFLSGAGLVPAHLEYAIPRIRQYAHAALPRFLTTEDLERVLSIPIEATPEGLRRHAMLLLLARLGLRAGEVPRIQLEDIDWRAGSLLIRAGKNHRERILPLTEEVGAALARYVKDGRPTSPHRRVFLGLCPPHRPLVSSAAVIKAAQTALAQAGIHMSRPGAHVFRHTLATHLVCRGTTFKEVADVLGHQSLLATSAYAKLDLASLAKVAGVWPGGAE